MAQLKITVTTTNFKRIKDFSFDYDMTDLNDLHTGMANDYPDCFVNFTLDNGSFICGQPVNMAKDEIAVNEDKMSWEEYKEKWYAMHETEEDRELSGENVPVLSTDWYMQ